MKARVAIVFLLHLFSPRSEAQFNETIRTSRPGQAIGSFTPGKGIFQVQSGVNYFGSNNSALDYKDQGMLSNTVIRYGLAEDFEVNGQLNYTHQSINEQGTTSTKQGIDALDIGMRYHVYTSHGAMPNIGIQFRMRLPVLSKDYEIKTIAPLVALIASHRLTEKFYLITNWGVSWNGNDSTPTGTYVINVSFPFTKNLGAFVENYGTLSAGIFNTKFDTGLAWLINKNLQLDLYGGYAVNHGLYEHFISTGISARTSREK